MQFLLLFFSDWFGYLDINIYYLSYIYPLHYFGKPSNLHPIRRQSGRFVIAFHVDTMTQLIGVIYAMRYLQYTIECVIKELISIEPAEANMHSGY